MLVLTRFPGQKLFIGEDVVLTVLGIRGDKVRVGIEAPRSVKVWRGEIKVKIDESVGDDEDDIGTILKL